MRLEIQFGGSVFYVDSNEIASNRADYITEIIEPCEDLNNEYCRHWSMVHHYTMQCPYEQLEWLLLTDNLREYLPRDEFERLKKAKNVQVRLV